MKKLLLVLLVVCLSGCTQTIQNDPLKNSQSIKQDDKQKVVEAEKKQLMDGIKQTMPEEIYQELTNKKVVYEIDDIITIGNDQNNPTLRLDFAYQDGQLVQFVNKEYGFLDTLPTRMTSEQQAKETAKTFAKVFLNQDVKLQKTTALSGYDTDQYITFKDENHHTYLVALNINVLLKYNENS
ncbi:hypothetical protein [Massilimicrobiota sp. An134]|uniref:hypothetical protein n=1 Tax=Massilimicrobiota sp. An134 TaxID=1965557 RepID=UPI000B38EA0E|nr:hypothetical protein [Massilimicrobiota sp. An134]OUQ29125.1 hypothetical protein B5E79_08950 [Massilimicrobiota sp. An134]